MTALWWTNVLLYSVQVGIVVALAGIAPWLLRLRLPRARLVFWQAALAACVLLPFVHPWRQSVASGDVSVTTTILAVAPQAAHGRPFPVTEFALVVLAAGALLRLAWIVAGFVRLRRYRRESSPLSVALPWPTRAEVRVAAVPGPVTFGALRPVVLVPRSFPELGSEAQNAILCHELLHVARRDWVFTILEELVRAPLWFHPAIWWLLSEIQLAREQAVDAEAVRLTRAKDQYVDALLAMAGARQRPDLVPAPLFLRRRHLKQRLVTLFEEVRMSKTRLLSALAGGLCILVAACWFAAATFPLAAAPQVVADAPGVAVDTGGAALLHRTGVPYPDAARAGRVQGTVTVEVQLDNRGDVSDARILSGPAELRASTLESVLHWHFAQDSAGATRQVTVAFQLPSSQTGAPPNGDVLSRKLAAEEAGVRQAGAKNQAVAVEGRTLKSVSIIGLSAALHDELLAKLPLHQGDIITPDLLKRTAETVQQFDEHLGMSAVPTGTGEAILQIVAPGAVQRIKIGGNVQQAKLISKPVPKYPPDAKAARIQGVVRLQAVIAKDGVVKTLDVLEGDPLLAGAAVEAVKQWVYQPTWLNGEPVEVQTQIDVNFTLLP